MKYFSIIMSLIILSGCVSREEIIAKRAAKDHASCVSKGFTPNTDTFRLCLDNRNIERKANQAAHDAFMANQKANSAKAGATHNCIWGGGVMVGDTCLK